MPKTVRAFTLIELLVVIVIIGILATISIAMFQSYQEKAAAAAAIAGHTGFKRKMMSVGAVQGKQYTEYVWSTESNLYSWNNSGVNNCWGPGLSDYPLQAENLLYPSGSERQTFTAVGGRRFFCDYNHLTHGLPQDPLQDSGAISGRDFTWSFLIKVSSVPIWPTFQWAWQLSPGTNQAFLYGSLERLGLGADYRIHTYNVNSTGNTDTFSSLKMSDDQWHWLVIQKSGSEMKFYLDGEIAHTITGVTDLPAAAGIWFSDGFDLSVASGDGLTVNDTWVGDMAFVQAAPEVE